ncbi:hypothetical protein BDR26DRAFT_860179 [Obelidium mucronatum]|nr:hypothetical protein BDR26DRAFT_860179 [Obelidium mucronatum]
MAPTPIREPRSAGSNWFDGPGNDGLAVDEGRGSPGAAVTRIVRVRTTSFPFASATVTISPLESVTGITVTKGLIVDCDIVAVAVLGSMVAVMVAVVSVF